jgi:hypothetical protein
LKLFILKIEKRRGTKVVKFRLLTKQTRSLAQQSCAAACAQKLRFCCKPVGLLSEAEQARKGFVSKQVIGGTKQEKESK